ncbi:MAG: MmcQ/YjbR family DNA-binding protein [Bacteroidetes bacterium]|nr:MmcQ/YjbR family DNA-binding protein [Bacteroidota bacterium]MBL6963909.1 MmcQ/YjbR family DNA-binding protein [Bacteroidota bacterium]
MNIETIRDYCISKKAATEGFPFDEVTLVFKVMGKMFALTKLEGDLILNLKCDPEMALELRASNPETVLPGWHMNKKNWNTIHIDNSIDKEFVFKWIDHSYDEVVNNLPRKLKEELAKL